MSSLKIFLFSLGLAVTTLAAPVKDDKPLSAYLEDIVYEVANNQLYKDVQAKINLHTEDWDRYLTELDKKLEDMHRDQKLKSRKELEKESRKIAEDFALKVIDTVKKEDPKLAELLEKLFIKVRETIVVLQSISDTEWLFIKKFKPNLFIS
ncbi:uncharacterized protein LOC126837133 [Adelges cooleyi]|uniref:uncharacterized protein LOC126837133 n=1 Tax=Adelges cooleyi TaxID=133065 RepID=UPI00217F2999|nr:uncharacterized protein LOC126837133 [Adelges cooleyi]